MDREQIRALFPDVPESLAPEFVMAAVNEKIVLSSGPLQVVRGGAPVGRIDGSLYLRWLPKPAIEFSGVFTGTWAPRFDDESLEVEATDLGLTFPAMLTHVPWIVEGHPIRGVLATGVNRSLPAVDRIRFYLVRFADFIGAPVLRATEDSCEAYAGRLTMSAKGLTCTVDAIPEVRGLSEQAEHEPGYLISHVGELSLCEVVESTHVAEHHLDALYWLFAFMNGARTGPILPSAGTSFCREWLQVAPWALGGPFTVQSWLPTHSRLHLDDLFDGFLSLWSEEGWNEPLRTSLAWYLAANAAHASNQLRIPLIQIALELLAWVRLVERGREFTERQFDDLHAAGRIAALLAGCGIPTAVPARLPELSRHAASSKRDAAECLVQLRNRLAHPTARNREGLKDVDGVLYWQAAQLGLELFELVLLALCGYRGKYACRAFRGWKGNDEIPVPWIPDSEEGVLG